MKRDELIKQVKEKYASIASAESQQHFHDTTNEITSEAYYEKRACGQKVGRKECTNQCTVTNNERKR